ncbi:MAG: GH92 family glycosyl hydrolase [Bacteroidia bacterium]
MRVFFRLLPLSLLLLPACQTPAEKPAAPAADVVQYVDPFIGTAAHGHTYPGATVPFGMVQLSPDNGTQGWDWCSGYNYADSIIVGFSHTHLSGTGIGDLCDVLVMPVGRAVDLARMPENRQELDYASAFLHDEEAAEPGYYRVRLAHHDIQAELTSTLRCGIHRYTFPDTGLMSLVVDLAFHINWDKPTATRIARAGDHTLVGYRHSTGWAKDQRLFFAIRFSQPVARIEAAEGTEKRTFDGEIAGSLSRVQVFFAPEGDRVVQVQVGISSASEAAALAALDEVQDKGFDDLRAEARRTWAEALARIEIASDNDAVKTIFYTALYHSYLAPVVYSDAQGAYKGADSTTHQSDRTRYDILSLWDTFRAAHPLFTLTQPERVDDMIRSLLAHYQEYGLLPVWSLLGNETNTMTGYHAIPVIADAYFKGFRDWDVELAYEAMKKSAMQDIRGTDFLRQYSYIPHDKAGESVTRTLEYCYDDWCIAQMAQALGKTEDYAYFSQRAGWYRNLFDSTTGFMRARLSDGTWKTPFDPYYSSHDVTVSEYTEGNAWQHSWFVPHDVQGLIGLYGGQAPFVRMLDSLFSASSELKGDFVSADISGLIGQYAHGNEPSHHIAYLYSYAGAPAKTAETVRRIMDTQYTVQPDGLCGNEDCGQMSAWYVFSAIGFYPVNPAAGVYVLGSPMVESATLRLPGGKTFTVRAPGVAQGHLYIQSARLNGQPLDQAYLRHADIVAGGELVLEMGPTPHPQWGSAGIGG